MIKNYLKTAFRSFWKNKWFTLINTIGLSIGICAALVIYLVAHFDLTFDKFEADSNRIYRVVTNFTFSGTPSYNPGVSDPLAMGAKASVTGLELLVPLNQPLFPDVQPGENISSEVKQKFRQQKDITYTTADYFKLIGYKWLAGNPATLNEPFHTVLTADRAQQYFPGESLEKIIGKTVVYDSVKTTVTGIVAPLTENTGFTFHDFISYNTLQVSHQLNLRNWGRGNVKTQLFFKLAPAAKAEVVTKQLNALLARNLNNTNKHKTQALALQPLNDIHFSTLYGGIASYDAQASKSVIYGLVAIAIFLLLLACINFINLSTAQGVSRAKEIGIRKTLGSSRALLIYQFLTEIFLVTIVAFGISLLMAPYLLKLFAGFIPEGIHLDLVHQTFIWEFGILLIIGVGLAAGTYPALVLSGYKPILVLKNQTQAQGQTRKTLLRKTLTVSQFVIAQFFIIATVMVGKQIYYAVHKDLGFTKDGVVAMNAPYKNATVRQNKELFAQLKSTTGVAMVSMGHDAPTSENTSSTEAEYRNGKTTIHMDDFAMKFGDENYIKLYHIPLLAGRNLLPTDTNHAFLVNEAFLRRANIKRPQDAVGQFIDNFNGDRRMEIVGVVADFDQGSVRMAIWPMVLMTSPDLDFSGTFHILLNPNSEKWASTLAAIRNEWHKVYPDDPDDLQFVDESIARLYDKEQHTATLLQWATGLSILISCMGLLGLTIYSTTQRTKEIGVRKVLGASAARIMFLLSKEIMLLIVLASVIAIPAAVYAINLWMQDFAKRTEMSWWVFAVCASGLLIVALATSAFQTIRAALANPVKSLRSE
ncbi:MAG: ABC transporter permease [Bacteroidota bacterium]